MSLQRYSSPIQSAKLRRIPIIKVRVSILNHYDMRFEAPVHWRRAYVTEAYPEFSLNSSAEMEILFKLGLLNIWLGRALNFLALYIYIYIHWVGECLDRESIILLTFSPLRCYCLMLYMPVKQPKRTALLVIIFPPYLLDTVTP